MIKAWLPCNLSNFSIAFTDNKQVKASYCSEKAAVLNLSVILGTKLNATYCSQVWNAVLKLSSPNIIPQNAGMTIRRILTEID